MIIFYFSGTGNTRYVSEYFAHLFKIEAVDITKLNQTKANELINQNDHIFLLYPIYGSDMPDNMKQFIEKMPMVTKKSIGVICTQLMFSGDGASIAFRKLKAKGYDQRWAFQINMPNNLCMKGMPFSQCSEYEVHEKKYLVKARAKLDEIAELVKKDKRKLVDHTIFHMIAAEIQRFPYRFGKTMMAKQLDVSSELCTGCGLCVKICPNDVIKMEKAKAIFVFKQDCTMCFRCINFCNYQAILYHNSIKLPQYKGPTKKIYNDIIKG